MKRATRHEFRFQGGRSGRVLNYDEEEEIIRQVNAMGTACEYSCYRTGAGAEVELVIQGSFGRGAMEIKHASTVSARDLRGLRDFVTAQKAPIGIVINNDVSARQYEDRLIGVPMSWL